MKRIRKWLAVALAATMVAGIAPVAMAAPVGDNKMRMTSVELGSVVNYPNSWFTKEKSSADYLEYTVNSTEATRVPIKVEFEVGDNIDTDAFVFSGSDGSAITYAVAPKRSKTVKGDYKPYKEAFSPVKDNDGNTHTYNYYNLDEDAVKAEGFTMFGTFPHVMKTKAPTILTFNSVNDTIDGLGIGSKNATEGKSFQWLGYSSGTNTWYVLTDAQVRALSLNKLDMSDLVAREPSSEVYTATILAPISTREMTITITAKIAKGAQKGTYAYANFVVKAKAAAAPGLQIKSATKLDYNNTGARFAINNFTKDTLTIAVNTSVSEFGFHLTLMQADGSALPNDIYDLELTSSTRSALVRTMGYVENSGLDVYLRNPGTSAAYTIDGKLYKRNTSEVAYTFRFIVTLTASNVINPSTYTVSPTALTIEEGKSANLSITASGDLNLNKSKFVSQDTNIATVAYSGGLATVVGVKPGQTVVRVTIDGSNVTTAIPVVVTAKATTPPTKPPTEVPQEFVKMRVATQTSNLNFRSKPSTSGAVVAKLARGSTIYVDLDSETNNWYRAYILKSGKKVYGYVFGQYISL